MYVEGDLIFAKNDVFTHSVSAHSPTGLQVYTLYCPAVLTVCFLYFAFNLQYKITSSYHDNKLLYCSALATYDAALLIIGLFVSAFSMKGHAIGNFLSNEFVNANI